jgi:hypothetical protein
MSGIYKAKVRMTRRAGAQGLFHATAEGKRVLKVVGTFMAEGATVSAKTWHDEQGCEWMAVRCVPEGVTDPELTA